MTVDPRTPVITGAASATQRVEASDLGLEAVDLMATAARRAAEPLGARLLGQVDTVVVPRGSWSYGDAARLMAERVGARGARTLCAEIGVLQTTLFSWSASEIRAGRADVVLICGGEARWRDVVAARRGGDAGGAGRAPWTDDRGARPDLSLKADADIISREEIDAGLTDAPSQYALLENAYRGARGLSLEDHLAEVAGRWADFNRVARANPDAWVREPWDAAELLGDGRGNRMIAFPYRKWHVSQWNVDQAAAVILCSAEAARRLGVAAERQIFIHAVAESNHMLPVTTRPSLSASPGFRWAGRAALAGARLAPEEVDHVDLYSCFPVAVSIQAEELGLDSRRSLTVTGGMTWAGGPLNNYVLQSAAVMYTILRERPRDRGLLTAVSGMLTKQGVMVWSGEPPPGPVVLADVTAEVERISEPVPLLDAAKGEARVLTYTVTHDREGLGRAVALVEPPGAVGRSLVSSSDPEVALAMEVEDRLGASVRLDGRGGFTA